MKHLETLKTSPHKNFDDITDEVLFNIAFNDFGLRLKSLDYIKDIINIYSYVVEGEYPEDAFISKDDEYLIDTFEFIFPDDFDIMNAAFSTAIKISNFNATQFGASIDLTEGSKKLDEDLDYFINRFKKNIIHLQFLDEIEVYSNHKIRKYSDVTKANTRDLINREELFEKIVKKKLKITTYVEDEKLVGNLLIDFSISVFNDNYMMLDIVYNNIQFKENMVLKIYSITVKGVIYLGEATDALTMIKLIKNTKFVIGEIDINVVRNFMNSLDGKITFITDSEDFEPKEFKNFNCNLILLNDEGRIYKFK